MTPERWQRVQEILAAAAETGPAERRAFLDDACRGDAELRAEVESLLASLGAAAPDFLESPAIGGVTGVSPAAPRAASPSLARGTRLGPYEILALIGAGGMGEVYRARDTRLNRDVAVKVLPPPQGPGTPIDSRARRALRQEALTLSRLSGPWPSLPAALRKAAPSSMR